MNQVRHHARLLLASGVTLAALALWAAAGATPPAGAVCSGGERMGCTPVVTPVTTPEPRPDTFVPTPVATVPPRDPGATPGPTPCAGGERMGCV